MPTDIFPLARLRWYRRFRDEFSAQHLVWNLRPVALHAPESHPARCPGLTTGAFFTVLKKVAPHCGGPQGFFVGVVLSQVSMTSIAVFSARSRLPVTWPSLGRPCFG